MDTGIASAARVIGVRIRREVCLKSEPHILEHMMCIQVLQCKWCFHFGEITILLYVTLDSSEFLHLISADCRIKRRKQIYLR